MTDPTSPTAPFAVRLNHLFATVRPAGQEREHTNSEVAAATGLSGTYLGYLRKGVRDNPSIEAVQAIARFFGVRAGSLVDDDRDDEESRLLQAMRNRGVQQLAMRAAEANLSPAALDAVTAMIDHVKRLEKGIHPESDS